MAVQHGSIARWTLNTVGTTCLCARIASATVGSIRSISLTLQDGVSALQHRTKAVGIGEGHHIRHGGDSQKAESNERCTHGDD
jgi:hypothetical protein